MNMVRREFAFVMALGATLSACQDTTSVTVGIGRLRVVNSVFQGTHAAGALPGAVDVLVDSAMDGAGLAWFGVSIVSLWSRITPQRPFSFKWLNWFNTAKAQ